MDTETCTKYIKSYGYYSEATKLEVVGAVTSGKLSQEEARSKYGVKGHSTILKWINKYQGIKMKRVTKPSFVTSKQNENAKLKEEKKQLEGALLKATVRVHCLEAIIEELETKSGVDLKKAYTQRS